jgi:hypothetical protein
LTVFLDPYESFLFQMLQGFLHCFQLYAHTVYKVLNGQVAFLSLSVTIKDSKENLLRRAQTGILHDRFDNFHILTPVLLYHHLRPREWGVVHTESSKIINPSIFRFPIEVVAVQKSEIGVKEQVPFMISDC